MRGILKIININLDVIARVATYLLLRKHPLYVLVNVWEPDSKKKAIFPTSSDMHLASHQNDVPDLLPTQGNTAKSVTNNISYPFITAIG